MQPAKVPTELTTECYNNLVEMWMASMPLNKRSIKLLQNHTMEHYKNVP